MVGNWKLRHKTLFCFFFTFAKFSRLARVDFGSVLFQLFSTLVFSLYSFDCSKTYSLAANFIGKFAQTLNFPNLTAKFTLWTEKMCKKRVFRGFPENSEKTFRNFIASLQLSSNWQDSCPLYRMRCTKNEKGNFVRLKLGFGPKNEKKWCFGVFRYALEQFGILLCRTKDAQNQMVATQLVAQVFETRKRQL